MGSFTKCLGFFALVCAAVDASGDVAKRMARRAGAGCDQRRDRQLFIGLVIPALTTANFITSGKPSGVMALGLGFMRDYFLATRTAACNIARDCFGGAVIYVLP